MTASTQPQGGTPLPVRIGRLQMMARPCWVFDVRSAQWYHLDGDPRTCAILLSEGNYWLPDSPERPTVIPDSAPAAPNATAEEMAVGPDDFGGSDAESHLASQERIIPSTPPAPEPDTPRPWTAQDVIALLLANNEALAIAGNTIKRSREELAGSERENARLVAELESEKMTNHDIRQLEERLAAQSAELAEAKAVADAATKGVYSQWELDKAKVIGSLNALELFKVPQPEAQLAQSQAEVEALKAQAAKDQDLHEWCYVNVGSDNHEVLKELLTNAAKDRKDGEEPITTREIYHKTCMKYRATIKRLEAERDAAGLLYRKMGDEMMQEAARANEAESQLRLATRKGNTETERGLFLRERIRQYLGNGGLFNPELMEHEKVRELIMDLADWMDGNKPRANLLSEIDTARSDAAANRGEKQ